MNWRTSHAGRVRSPCRSGRADDGDSHALEWARACRSRAAKVSASFSLPSMTRETVSMMTSAGSPWAVSHGPSVPALAGGRARILRSVAAGGGPEVDSGLDRVGVDGGQLVRGEVEPVQGA